MYTTEILDGNKTLIFINGKGYGEFDSEKEGLLEMVNETINELDLKLAEDPHYKVKSEHLEEAIFTENYDTVATILFELKQLKQ